MEKNVNLLIMGGDPRYLEIINQLASKGIRIFLAGFDQLTFSHPNISNQKPDQVDFEQIDAILIPLHGTSADGEIDADYSDENIHLSIEMLKRTPDHCAVYTGISNDYLDRITREVDRNLIRLTARDDVAVLNSIPTAEAALKIAIEETDYTIHNANVMVLGFGRVGETLARLFSAVGANVSVAARKDGDLARIMEMRLRPVHMANVADHMSEINICINTVPHMILDAAVLSKMSASSLIIDIASKPGGTDFKFAEEKGLKAIHALGLPGKTAPKTGGEIISKVLYKLLV
ncbi:dipicolinic acid synthetase subunit A [Siminovitchia acidinfaciens]|uniref:Dipicolinic acid synthetase subunit A n=1 Tax=Siminovitchia acidinfaciens TaxID=2321395 RepID=A0A429XV30_9BACI|nr:dipicolinic acid synthetase subunit A [Siminovitchia acidinfaciens]RST72041.1 dipicolinic acid synthetase subunit A [Siminovitchia acidinfaciens]